MERDLAALPALLTRYPLPEGSEIAVSPGATVSAGDTLAHAPPPARVVALALARGEPSRSRAAVGTHVTQGQTVGAWRQGIRRQRAIAPVGGTVTHGAPDALVIAPDAGRAPVQARYGGTVVAVSPRGVVVATPAHLARFAFAVGLHAREITLAPEGTRVRPFLSDPRQITAETGALIVGAVSVAVARALWVSQEGNTPHRPHGVVIVLVGPGDAAQGERAIVGLHGGAPRQIVIDRHARTLAVIDGGAPVGEATAITRREPARWGERGEITAPPVITTLDSGLRAWVVTVRSERHGTGILPVQNAADIALTP